MQVTFSKLSEQRLSYWEAVRGKRTIVPGSTMALGRGDMPHDLKQFVVEATAGITYGFWGSVEQGATFKSTGRKRTKPGMAVIARNRSAIDDAEAIVGGHVRSWERGGAGPVSDALSRIDALWVALPPEASLTLHWPSLRIAS